VFPGWWMSEGGQSSTGQLIEFVMTDHTAFPELKARAAAEDTDVHASAWPRGQAACGRTY
jgi:ribulose kinase